MFRERAPLAAGLTPRCWSSARSSATFIFLVGCSCWLVPSIVLNVCDVAAQCVRVSNACDELLKLNAQRWAPVTLELWRFVLAP